MSTENHNWSFLKDTYWYVPVNYLLALQMSAEDTTPTRMVDQTVWQIVGYEQGYLWGNAAILLYEEGTTPSNAPTGMQMLGTVTPNGQVQITFMPINPIGAAIGTSGWGNMRMQKESWAFEMQMSSGTTELLSHWAYMWMTQKGELSWRKLPGTEYSVPEFLKAAGF